MENFGWREGPPQRQSFTSVGQIPYKPVHNSGGMMVMRTTINPLGKAQKLAADAKHMTRKWLSERRMRVGITGLSRAGKTILITSMIQNLEAYVRGVNTLEAFSRNGKSDSIVRMEIKPIQSEKIPLFPYEEITERLTSRNNDWPESTTTVSGLEVVLHLRSRFGGRLHVEFIDYPGEWIVDRTMLIPGLSFRDWSRGTVERLLPLAPVAEMKEFIIFMESVGWYSSIGAQEAALGAHRRFKSVLEACKDKAGLRYLQPGRFLLPGPNGDVPSLWFAPVTTEVNPDKAVPESLYRVMERRFAAYVRDARNFSNTHFGSIDHHIVLVDVLSALAGGKTVYDDTRLVVKEIAETFARKGNPILRLASKRSAPKATFVATKADYLHQDEVGNLVVQLSAMVAGSLNQMLERGFSEKPRAIASVWCSKDTMLNDQPGVLFRNSDTNCQTMFRFGRIPSEVPSDAFWAREGAIFSLPRMDPPYLAPTDETGIRHRGLDEVLFDVLGSSL
jgi:uncharacterized protein